MSKQNLSTLDVELIDSEREPPPGRSRMREGTSRGRTARRARLPQSLDYRSMKRRGLQPPRGWPFRPAFGYSDFGSSTAR